VGVGPTISKVFQGNSKDFQGNSKLFPKISKLFQGFSLVVSFVSNGLQANLSNRGKFPGGGAL
jgi:hypothetical protein